jgi:ABC-type molybdate transport system substrate-binding protein
MVALASSSAAASEIRVMAAGSLRDVFAAVFADYAKLYGDSFAPVWGPSGVLRERLQKGEAFDVFASAGLPHAQVLTEAGVSGPSVLFVRNALCIVTDADRQLDAGNLVETLLKPEIRIGTSTPVSDPAGDYTWEMFHKIDAQRPGTFEILSRKAQQLDGSAATATLVNGRPRMLVALDDRQIDLFIAYCSGARDRQSVVEIPIGRAAAGAYSRRRIRTDGCAQGGAGCGRFRDVFVVATRTGQPKVLWLHSSSYSCRANWKMNEGRTDCLAASLVPTNLSLTPGRLRKRPISDRNAVNSLRTAVAAARSILRYRATRDAPKGVSIAPSRRLSRMPR